VLIEAAIDGAEGAFTKQPSNRKVVRAASSKLHRHLLNLTTRRCHDIQPLVVVLRAGWHRWRLEHWRRRYGGWWRDDRRHRRYRWCLVLLECRGAPELVHVTPVGRVLGLSCAIGGPGCGIFEEAALPAALLPATYTAYRSALVELERHVAAAEAERAAKAAADVQRDEQLRRQAVRVHPT